MINKIYLVFDKTKNSLKIKSSLIKKIQIVSLKKSSIIVVLGGDGFMLKTLKKLHKLKKPFYGIKPIIVDEKGKTLKGAAKGRLCIAQSWPGQMRTVYGDHQRFIDTYFSQFDGKYFTGDGCRRDEDGYYWITGRGDDVIIVSGHNLGKA